MSSRKGGSAGAASKDPNQKTLQESFSGLSQKKPPTGAIQKKESQVKRLPCHPRFISDPPHTSWKCGGGGRGGVPMLPLPSLFAPRQIHRWLTRPLALVIVAEADDLGYYGERKCCKQAPELRLG